MNELFAWRRLGLLIRNDFIGGYRMYLNIGTVVFIIMALNAIPAAGFGQIRDRFYYTIFWGMLFWWGSVHASLAFYDLLDKKMNESFLLLPASTLEKTVARYLYSSVFFVLHMLVFTTITAFIIEGVNMLLFGRYNELFNPFDPVVWKAIGLFILIQPIFFLGSAWFKRLRWFKTILALSAIGMLLGLLLLITVLIFFGGSFHEIYILNPGGFNDLDVNINMFRSTVLVLKILFYGVVPPFCLIVTYLRVKETQVSHGI